MKLFELKSTREWEWESTTPNKLVATFTSEPKPTEYNPDPEPIKYYVEFDKVEQFQRIFPNDRQTKEQLENAGITTAWDITFFFRSEFEYREVAAVRTGGEMQVFATVFEIVKSFIQMVNPQAVYFAGDAAETTRTRLYNRLLNTFKKQGWEIAHSYNPHNDAELFIAYK